MANKDRGWIALHRQIQEHWLWSLTEPFDKRSAWIDLLLLANHESSKGIYKGKVVTYERGTVNRSISWLAARWGWGREKTRNYLNALESDNMLTIKRMGNRTVLTLVNYSNFQNMPTVNRAINRQSTEQRTDNASSTYNNDRTMYNNVNNARPRKHKTYSERMKEAWDNLGDEWFSDEELAERKKNNETGI